MTTIDHRGAHIRLRQLQTQVSELLRVLPPIIAEQHRSLADGWPGSGDGTGVKGSSSTSSTEAAAMSRLQKITGDERADGLDDVADWLSNATTGLRLLSEWCAKRTPKVDIAAERCNGGAPSIEDWTRPDCTNLVDYYAVASGAHRLRGDGLCSACRKRKERAERLEREAVA